MNPSSPDFITRRKFLPLLAAGAVGPWQSRRARAVESESEPADGDRLRVAQIGTTHPHAAGKLQAVRALADRFEVVAWSDSDPARRRAAAGREAFAGIETVEPEALFDLPNLDLILVETDIEEAPEMTRRALEAGAHVHLDKPGGLDHEEFAAVRRLAEERGLILQMGYMLRHQPMFEFLFEIVREGWLGDVIEVDASMGKRASATERRQLAALPGGGMFELGCHLIDAVMTVLGKPERIHAVATPTATGAEGGFEDNQLAVLEYPAKGANAVVRCHHADPFGGPRRRFGVAGTAGFIEVAPLESGRAVLMLEHDRPGHAAGRHELHLPMEHGRYGGEFIALGNAIRGRQPLWWDADHDVAVHAAVLRASGVTSGASN